jgi:hypothetical protein
LWRQIPSEEDLIAVNSISSFLARIDSNDGGGEYTITGLYGDSGSTTEDTNGISGTAYEVSGRDDVATSSVVIVIEAANQTGGTEFYFSSPDHPDAGFWATITSEPSPGEYGFEERIPNDAGGFNTPTSPKTGTAHEAQGRESVATGEIVWMVAEEDASGIQRYFFTLTHSKSFDDAGSKDNIVGSITDGWDVENPATSTIGVRYQVISESDYPGSGTPSLHTTGVSILAGTSGTNIVYDTVDFSDVQERLRLWNRDVSIDGNGNTVLVEAGSANADVDFDITTQEVTTGSTGATLDLTSVVIAVLKGIAGWDAAKDQALVNRSGTLGWEDLDSQTVHTAVEWDDTNATLDFTRQTVEVISTTSTTDYTEQFYDCDGNTPA